MRAGGSRYRNRAVTLLAHVAPVRAIARLEPSELSHFMRWFAEERQDDVTILQ